ncbi:MULTISPECIES: class I adenylate-forming enzyme family protein [Metallosphaera]|uniref:class I adenylate-forming enzyme family protein n=1 Tax=Metallosphaera TaxID=41980 RepID=UPI001F06B087|nr:class I adenylate-forming enzyme family protein [Metallosphaera sedula]MCH1770005.1 acyl--CoA ligase [Metallosphaera sedula]MCP6728161.1 acyl--CoA ligase [Metallosphaera sedula]
MSIAKLLEKWSKVRPNSYLIPGVMTYEQARDRVARLASKIPERGVVAHFMFNSAESVLSYIAGFWAGTKVVAIDPLTSAEDLRFILEDSSPDMILVDQETLSREKEVLKDFKAVIPSFEGEVKERPEEYNDNIPGLSYYYAGIAGRTMEVIHSGSRVEFNDRVLYESIGLSRISTILTVPIAHVLGNSVLGVTLEAGGQLIPIKKFDPVQASEMINMNDVNFLATVPMVYDSLIEKGHGLQSLEVCISTAAPLFPNTVKGFKEKFGKDIIQQYGFTEGLVLTLQPRDITEIITIGKPLKHVDIKVVKEDGKDAMPGEVGELWVKAPWLMLGYKDTKENDRVWYNGWLKTGDLVSIDERGLLFFKGVKKRMLKYKGYPIFPRDLESILLTHPAVEKAEVVGEDAGNLGQEPVAKVTLRKKVSEQELLDYVNSKVAFYKKLKRIYIVNKLE